MYDVSASQSGVQCLLPVSEGMGLADKGSRGAGRPIRGSGGQGVQLEAVDRSLQRSPTLDFSQAPGLSITK